MEATPSCILVVGWVDIGVSKNRGTPKSSILIGFSINYKPSILWYPYFWQHPYLAQELKEMLGHRGMPTIIPVYVRYFFQNANGKVHL